MSDRASKVYRFEAYELDEAAGELRRGGEVVELQPKPFELLRILLRERHRVVSAEELLDELWPDVSVTPSSLNRAVSHARRAIGDAHSGERIKSVPRRGYRFAAPVVEIGEELAAAAPASPAETRPGGALAPPPLVGRAASLERLREAFAQALAGRRALALVSGRAGIGKTRLVEQLAGEARERGVVVAFARAREGEGVPVFWLWVQVLRQLAAQLGAPPELSRAVGASPELASLLPEVEPLRQEGGGALAPEESRFLFFDAVARTLAQASRARPLLLVLEDLQWAGAGALRLLEHVVGDTDISSLMLVATVRDEAVPSDALARSLSALRRDDRCLALPLGPLSRRDVAQLVESAMGRAAPADLTSELFARTEGVPLFLREALRFLAERGEFARPAARLRQGALLPAHSVDLIQRAIEALPEACGALLGAASVIGREFALADAAELGAVSREEALDLLETAQRAGIVEPLAEGLASFRFAHALFQEAAAHALPAGRRARLHRAAADLLERRFAGDLGRVIGAVAQHRVQAIALGDAERAFALSLEAAERAGANLAWEQAAAHYEQALAALDHVEPALPQRRLETLLRLGDSHFLSGDRERRRAVLREAMELARELGDRQRFADAAIGFCDVSEWSSRDEEARDRVAQALADADGLAPVTRARLETRAAYTELGRSPELARPLARTALASARGAGDPDALLDALYVLAFALAGPDHIAERRALAREGSALAEHTRRRDTGMILLIDAASDGLAEGDAAIARAFEARAVRLAAEVPHPRLVWHLRVYQTGLALLEGRFADAERQLEEALGLGERVSHPYARGVHRAQEGALRFLRGDFAGYVRCMLPAARGPNFGPHWMLASIARANLAAGDETAAREALAALAKEGFEALPRNIRWTRAIAEIAHLCADLGDEELAPSLIALLEPLRHLHAVLPTAVCYAGPVHHALARLHEVGGRWGEALAHYEEAVAACERLGARPAEARARRDLAALLARRGQRGRGDAERRRAEALAAELGMWLGGRTEVSGAG